MLASQKLTDIFEALPIPTLNTSMCIKIRTGAHKILPIPKMLMNVRYVREFNERSQAAAMATSSTQIQKKKRTKLEIEEEKISQKVLNQH